MSVISLGNYPARLFDVEESDATDSYDAVRKAKAFIDKISSEGGFINEAIVSRDGFDGMVLISDTGKTMRFMHLNCGYSGTGPSCSSEVLVHAGFGNGRSRSEVLDMIAHGGDEAVASFHK
jgi:hypothetical protein